MRMEEVGAQSLELISFYFIVRLWWQSWIVEMGLKAGLSDVALDFSQAPSTPHCREKYWEDVF